MFELLLKTRWENTWYSIKESEDFAKLIRAARDWAYTDGNIFTVQRHTAWIIRKDNVILAFCDVENLSHED